MKRHQWTETELSALKAAYEDESVCNLKESLAKHLPRIHPSMARRKGSVLLLYVTEKLAEIWKQNAKMKQKNSRRVKSSSPRRRHSEETRAKISASMKGKPRKPHSEETRRKISESRLAGTRYKHHPPVRNERPDGRKREYTAEERKARSDRMLGNTLSPETRRNIQGKTIDSMKNGAQNNYLYERTNRFGMFRVRSMYELKALMLLEKDPAVKTVEYESRDIGYLPDGDPVVPPRTVIDFLVNGTRIIEVMAAKEIPNRYRNKDARIRALMEYCEKEGLIFEIWTERELGLIGPDGKSNTKAKDELKKQAEFYRVAKCDDTTRSNNEHSGEDEV